MIKLTRELWKLIYKLYITAIIKTLSNKSKACEVSTISKLIITKYNNLTYKLFF